MPDYALNQDISNPYRKEYPVTIGEFTNVINRFNIINIVHKLKGSSEYGISIQNNKINTTKMQVTFQLRKELYQNVREIILVLKLGNCHKRGLGHRIVLYLPTYQFHHLCMVSCSDLSYGWMESSGYGG